MKPLLVVAVLLLASLPLRAAPAVDVAGRGELLQEIETWRAMHLSQTSEKGSRVYRHSLKAIKNQVVAAAEEEALVQPKMDFEAWKTALLREKYAEVRATGIAG